MTVQAIVIAFTGLLTVLVGARWLSEYIPLPTPSLQFLLGGLLTNVVVMFGIDTGLRYHNFHDLVFYLFLPILVFAAAFVLPIRALTRVVLSISGLALIGLVLTAGLIACGVYYGIGHPTGFPWLGALLTGVLLAATDPAAVTGQTGTLKLNESTHLVLEGESLVNDATSVVLYSVVLGLAMSPMSGAAPMEMFGHAGLTFVKELLGGAAIGGVFAFLGKIIASRMDRRSPGAIRNGEVEFWISLTLAFGAYHLALAFHVSGVIACLVCGLWLNAARSEEGRETADPASSPDFTAHSWHLLANTANGTLFALMGATVSLNMFTERWLAMLIAIAATLLARFVSVHTLLAIAGLRASERLPGRQRSIVSLLGMRGSITLALVLSLPYELPYWWTVQSIAYGVVIFDLLIVAPLAPWILARLSRP